MLRAACARAEATTAGLPETGAWFVTAPDVDAAEIGLRNTGSAGARIGIREVTASDVRGRRAQAPSAFGFAATTVVVTGGGIDPISSPGPAIAIGHLRPPGMSSGANGA